MESIGAAGRNHDYLGGLVELCRCARGQHLELREGIAGGHLILRAHALHARRQGNKAHDAQAAVQWRVLNGLRVDDLAYRRIFGLDHGPCAGDFDTLCL